MAGTGEDPWRRRCLKMAATLVRVEAVRRRRCYSDAVVVALSLERKRKKQRQRGAEVGKEPKGRTPPLFNHALKG